MEEYSRSLFNIRRTNVKCVEHGNLHDHENPKCQMAGQIFNVRAGLYTCQSTHQVLVIRISTTTVTCCPYIVL